MNRVIKNDATETLRTMNKMGIKVDAVITDPPYGIDYRSKWGIGESHAYKSDNLRIRTKEDDIKGDKKLDWLPEYLKELHGVMKDNSLGMMFVGWQTVGEFTYHIKKFFNIKNIIIWEKNNTSMGDLKGQFAPKYEMIIFFAKGRKYLNGKRDPDIIKFAKTIDKRHPTPKPVEMLKYLLSKISKEGDTILDSFVGIGSTPVACIETGRNFIATEVVDKYIDVANERIEEARFPYTEPDLLDLVKEVNNG